MTPQKLAHYLGAPTIHLPFKKTPVRAALVCALIGAIYATTGSYTWNPQGALGGIILTAAATAAAFITTAGIAAIGDKQNRTRRRRP